MTGNELFGVIMERMGRAVVVTQDYRARLWRRLYRFRTSSFRTGCAVLVLTKARRRGEPMVTGYRSFGGIPV